MGDCTRYSCCARETRLGTTLPQDDPTLLAWELINEPTTVQDWDKCGDLALLAMCTQVSPQLLRSHGRTPGQSINSWVQVMAALVKQLDPNHMLLVGDVRWELHVIRGIGKCHVHRVASARLGRGAFLTTTSTMDTRWGIVLGTTQQHTLRPQGFSAEAAIANPNIDALTIHFYVCVHHYAHRMSHNHLPRLNRLAFPPGTRHSLRIRTSPTVAAWHLSTKSHASLRK